MKLQFKQPFVMTENKRAFTHEKSAVSADGGMVLTGRNKQHSSSPFSADEPKAPMTTSLMIIWHQC